MTAPATSTPPRRDPGQAERLLRRLDWQVIRRLDGLLQGDHRALFYGSGSDFADLREYQAQDDVRYIDWNVTARLDTPYVRQYIEDRELTAWLLLDRSSSMRFGHVDRTKETVLVELAATLGRLLTRDGNRVGAVLYDNAIERVVEPRGGRQQVLRLARDLLQPPPDAGAATDLERALPGRVSDTIRRRSLVFVLVRLHQRAGVGARAGDARAAPRGGRGPDLGPPRGRARRRRRRRAAGRRDRRADAGRHQRSRVPPTLRGRGRRARRAAAHGDPPRRVSTSTTSRPTTTSCGCSLRMVDHAQAAGPPVTFQAPGALLAPARWCRCSSSATCGSSGGGPPTSTSSARWRRPRPAPVDPSGGAGTSCRVVFLVGVVVLLVGLARPEANDRPAAPAGHGRSSPSTCRRA